MSNFYDTEPQPTASAIFHTTGGEIAVELFAKQTPLTCRNFLQHCLDGYYDNTIFHRLVPSFILQGGDPTGTGNGGESIYDGGALSGDLDPWPMDQRKGQNAGPYGINFKDEFHSRLKFNRRGLLAMANEGTPNTNSSQFFFTLDKTTQLDGKNTLFGRVAGSTIYNLAKMGEGELQEGTERPLYPVKIKNIEILTNPFTDMVKKERVAKPMQPQKQISIDKAKGKKKKLINKTLLSFGDDIEDDILASEPKPKKTKADKTKSTEKQKEKEKARKGTAREESPASEERIPRETTLPSRAVPLPKPKRERSESASGSERGPERKSESQPPPKKKMSALEKTNAEIAALKASMRRAVQEDEPEKSTDTKKSASMLEQLVPSNTTRGKRLGRGPAPSSRDPRILKVLGAFQSKLGVDHGDEAETHEDRKKDDGEEEGKEEGDGKVCDLHFIANCQSCRPWDKDEADEEDSDGDGWMSHTLNCAADKLGKDLSYRKKAEEELVVIDPLEKARNIRDEKRSRDGRHGNSRARDQARAAKMAQSAAAFGRGAK